MVMEKGYGSKEDPVSGRRCRTYTEKPGHNLKLSALRLDSRLIDGMPLFDRAAWPASSHYVDFFRLRKYPLSD